MLPRCTRYLPLSKDDLPEGGYPFAPSHLDAVARASETWGNLASNHDMEAGYRMLFREIAAVCVSDIADAIGAGVLCPDSLTPLPAGPREKPTLRSDALDAISFLRSRVADDIFADASIRQRTPFDGAAAIRCAIARGREILSGRKSRLFREPRRPQLS